MLCHLLSVTVGLCNITYVSHLALLPSDGQDLSNVQFRVKLLNTTSLILNMVAG